MCLSIHIWSKHFKGCSTFILFKQTFGITNSDVSSLLEVEKKMLWGQMWGKKKKKRFLKMDEKAWSLKWRVHIPTALRYCHFLLWWEWNYFSTWQHQYTLFYIWVTCMDSKVNQSFAPLHVKLNFIIFFSINTNVLFWSKLILEYEH